nr:unnamed protein product [Callosobruchus chinensis]
MTLAVIEKLSRDYFTRIGKPQAFLTDNGTHFSSPRNLKTKAEKRQRRHDKEHRVHSFNVGDKVLVRTHQQSSAECAEIKKFFLLFRDPATIVKIQGHNSYEIVEEATGINLGVQNVFNLEPYKVLPGQL